jgi:hypothetical protein
MITSICVIHEHFFNVISESRTAITTWLSQLNNLRLQLLRSARQSREKELQHKLNLGALPFQVRREEDQHIPMA